MIKLKNLWKIALATMAMSAMLVACDTKTKDDDGDENGVKAGIYLSGLNGNNWAGNTGIVSATGVADLMTKGDGEVYTFTFKAETKNPFPYGFKFTTENGWMEQFQAYNEKAETKSFRILDGSGVEADVFESTKAKLEAKDDDGNGIPDDATKFKMKDTLLYVVDKEYTVTFDKANMKVKITGEFEEVVVQTITVTINIDKAKLILSNVPTYNADDIAEINGSLFGWCGGSAQTLKSSNCEVTANWTGAADWNWIAEQQPKDAVTGANAWAKLAFTANSSEGWVPYNTTGEFTYDWNSRK